MNNKTDSMLTDKQISDKVESLVGCRFSEIELNKKLSQLFGCDVSVSEYEREECVKKDLPFLDNQLICEVSNSDLNHYY